MKPANLYYAIPAPYQNQLECVAAPPESYKANNSKNTTETVKYSRQGKSQHADKYKYTLHHLTMAQRQGMARVSLLQTGFLVTEFDGRSDWFHK